MKTTHHAQVLFEGERRFRPSCSCGWKGKRYFGHPNDAQKPADAHAHDVVSEKPCGKQKFDTEASAGRALVAAKIARSLHGNRKRREERSYYCHGCQAWHLTSKPLRDTQALAAS